MLGEWLFWLLAAVHRELLLVAAVGLALGGLDDLLIDIVYFLRRGWRDMSVYTRHRRMTSDTLPPSTAPGRIAVFTPAWKEANVIGPMLRHALAAWGDADYMIFVGVYPNDRDTIEVVARVAADNPRIIMAINDRLGPTTKADCLNTLWRALLREEARAGTPFKAVALHDAEDVVHADEIRLFDHLIDRFTLVQLPVLPLRGRGGWLARAVSDHYGDEFAESHGKGLIVREALGASIPSAGVACAFSRNALAMLEETGRGGPFDPQSLTEDYEAGLRVRERGGKGVFVRMRDRAGKLVAAREYFPDSIETAVRQKARWMVGISLAGWDRMGWGGGVGEIWMRLRDRRATLAALVLVAAYGTLILWPLLWLADWAGWQPMPSRSPTMQGLLGLNLILMLWRVAMRIIFSGRAYGWRYGLAAAPRMLVANLIAILAARRALFLYGRSLLGTPLKWDKTQHRFPQSAADI
ncbi:MAG: glycosyl transferase family protein [Sphingobium sp.]